MAEDVRFMGQVIFVFPSKREWNQEVSIFTAERWFGEPGESNEMKPSWFKLDEIPYNSMSQDARYWIPQVLNGTTVKMKIVFQDDKETVEEVSIL